MASNGKSFPRHVSDDRSLVWAHDRRTLPEQHEPNDVPCSQSDRQYPESQWFLFGILAVVGSQAGVQTIERSSRRVEQVRDMYSYSFPSVTDSTYKDLI